MDRDALIAGIESAGRRARWTRGLLVVSALLALGSLATDLWAIELFGRLRGGRAVGLDEAEALDGRELLLVLASVGVWLVTLVVWMCWVHRACANLRLAGSGRSRFTPGWSVGWHFVPVMNIVRVPAVMLDLAERSADGNQRWDPRPSRHVLIEAWWALVVLGSVLDRLLRMQLKDAVTPVDYVRVYRLSAIEEAIWIVCAVAAWLLVRRIDRLQREVLVLAPPVPASAPLEA